MAEQNDLRGALKDVLEVLAECPDDLREKAFEIMLRHRLAGAPVPAGAVAGTVGEEAQATGPDGVAKGADLEPTDLHVKARKLIDASGISIGDLNQLFYKENGDIKPLYDDLRSTQMAESQVRLALLEALEKAIQTGDFVFDIESVRTKCKRFKCYDAPNFVRNFRNSESLFDGFEKGAPSVKLSSQGREKLAAVVAELAQRS